MPIYGDIWRYLSCPYMDWLDVITMTSAYTLVPSSLWCQRQSAIKESGDTPVDSHCNEGNAEVTKEMRKCPFYLNRSHVGQAHVSQLYIRKDISMAVTMKTCRKLSPTSSCKQEAVTHILLLARKVKWRKGHWRHFLYHAIPAVRFVAPWDPDCSLELGGIHWSQWETVDEIMNKKSFWITETFCKVIASGK